MRNITIVTPFHYLDVIQDDTLPTSCQIHNCTLRDQELNDVTAQMSYSLGKKGYAIDPFSPGFNDYLKELLREKDLPPFDAFYLQFDQPSTLRVFDFKKGSTYDNLQTFDKGFLEQNSLPLSAKHFPYDNTTIINDHYNLHSLYGSQMAKALLNHTWTPYSGTWIITNTAFPGLGQDGVSVALP